MIDPWKVLRLAGVPDGAVRATGHRSDPGILREALRAALAQSPPGGSLDALWAWLRAYRHHWPQQFIATLGADGEAALALLSKRPIDANRYLKLRRIAVERLGSWT